jgi:DNA uptake protein ComE-like DNA-binding protein
MVVYLDAQGNKVEAGEIEFVDTAPNTNVTSIFAATHGNNNDGWAQPQLRINLATTTQLLKIAKIGRTQARDIIDNRPADGYTGFNQMKDLNPEITTEMWDLLKRNANFIFNEQDLI